MTDFEYFPAFGQVQAMLRVLQDSLAERSASFHPQPDSQH